ncbi:gene transfer agent family protein [Sphingobium phenoxybenzoativorans]|uniref:Gene transfer agent family protein n=1 Tax=Sphingobium phenoxybenzoativorans TaxID=1592790 RepID=A0A975Q2C7_9SPHN|nr:GTA-gp10 family protein [Sphingobium phenoxybenzoativorans]QUT06298.1 gene transfer agent family protein [Sphingobium phenoxybenzoativorans]
MTGQANPARGEAVLLVAGEALVVRPSFAALVAAEAELGPLFALVDRAAAGEMRLSEMAALFWHCIAARPEALTREQVGEAVVAMGLAQVSPVLKCVLRQVLIGASA